MIKFKHLLIGLTVFASAVLGDHYNVKDCIIEPLRYRNTKIDPASYQNPFQLKKKYWINKENNLEVYIGNDDKWYKVEKGLRVNERDISQILGNETKKIKPYLKEKIEDLKEWYGQNFKNGYPN